MLDENNFLGRRLSAFRVGFLALKQRIAKGFTLTEVLIALAIIGILSVLILPVITTRAQNKSFALSYESEVKQLLNSLTGLHVFENKNDIKDTMMYVDPAPADNDYSGSSGVYVKKYMKVAKYCGNTPGSCFASNYYQYENNDKVAFDMSDVKGACAVLKNGVSICIKPQIKNSEGSVESISGWIDLNGPKGPNVYGRDLRTFVVDVNEQVAWSEEEPTEVVTAAEPEEASGGGGENPPITDRGECIKNPYSKACCDTVPVANLFPGHRCCPWYANPTTTQRYKNCYGDPIEPPEKTCLNKTITGPDDECCKQNGGTIDDPKCCGSGDDTAYCCKTANAGSEKCCKKGIAGTSGYDKIDLTENNKCCQYESVRSMTINGVSAMTLCMEPCEIDKNNNSGGSAYWKTTVNTNAAWKEGTASAQCCDYYTRRQGILKPEDGCCMFSDVYNDSNNPASAKNCCRLQKFPVVSNNEDLCCTWRFSKADKNGTWWFKAHDYYANYLESKSNDAGTNYENRKFDTCCTYALQKITPTSAGASSAPSGVWAQETVQTRVWENCCTLQDLSPVCCHFFVLGSGTKYGRTELRETVTPSGGSPRTGLLRECCKFNEFKGYIECCQSIVDGISYFGETDWQEQCCMPNSIYTHANDESVPVPSAECCVDAGASIPGEMSATQWKNTSNPNRYSGCCGSGTLIYNGKTTSYKGKQMRKTDKWQKNCCEYAKGSDIGRALYENDTDYSNGCCSGSIYAWSNDDSQHNADCCSSYGSASDTSSSRKHDDALWYNSCCSQTKDKIASKKYYVKDSGCCKNVKWELANSREQNDVTLGCCNAVDVKQNKTLKVLNDIDWIKNCCEFESEYEGRSYGGKTGFELYRQYCCNNAKDTASDGYHLNPYGGTVKKPNDKITWLEGSTGSFNEGCCNPKISEGSDGVPPSKACCDAFYTRSHLKKDKDNKQLSENYRANCCKEYGADAPNESAFFANTTKRGNIQFTCPEMWLCGPKAVNNSSPDNDPENTIGFGLPGCCENSAEAHKENSYWQSGCCNYPTLYTTNVNYRGNCCNGDYVRQNINNGNKGRIDSESMPFCCDPDIAKNKAGTPSGGYDPAGTPNTNCCRYFKDGTRAGKTNFAGDNDNVALSKNYKIECCKQSTGDYNSTTDYCPSTCSIRWEAGERFSKTNTWKQYNFSGCCKSVYNVKYSLNNTQNKNWNTTDFWKTNCCRYVYTTSSAGTTAANVNTYYGSHEIFRASCCTGDYTIKDSVSNTTLKTSLQTRCCDPKHGKTLAQLEGTNAPNVNCCTAFKANNWKDFDGYTLTHAYKVACCKQGVCPDELDAEACFVAYEAGNPQLPDCCRYLALGTYTDPVTGNLVDAGSTKGDAVWQKTCCSWGDVVGKSESVTLSKIGINNADYRQYCCVTSGGSDGSVKKEDTNTNTVNDQRCCFYMYDENYSNTNSANLSNYSSEFCCDKRKAKDANWVRTDASMDGFRNACCMKTTSSSGTPHQFNGDSYCTCDGLYTKKSQTNLSKYFTSKDSSENLGVTCCSDLYKNHSRGNTDKWRMTCCKYSAAGNAGNSNTIFGNTLTETKFAGACCTGSGLGIGQRSDGSVVMDYDNVPINDKRCCDYTNLTSLALTTNASYFCCSEKSDEENWTETDDTMSTYRRACCVRADELSKGFCNCLGLYTDESVGASATTLTQYFSDNGLTGLCCPNLMSKTVSVSLLNNVKVPTQEKWQDTCCTAIKTLNVVGGSGVYQNNELWKKSCCDFPTDYVNNTAYRGMCCSGDGTRKSPNPDGSALISNKVTQMYCCNPTVASAAAGNPNTDCCRYFKDGTVAGKTNFAGDNDGTALSDDYKLACCKQSSGDLNQNADYCPEGTTKNVCLLRWQAGRIVSSPAKGNTWKQYNFSGCCRNVSKENKPSSSPTIKWNEDAFWQDNCCSSVGTSVANVHSYYPSHAVFRTHCCKNESNDHQLKSGTNATLSLSCCNPMLDDENPNPSEACCTQFKNNGWQDYDGNALTTKYITACCTNHSVCPDPVGEGCFVYYEAGQVDPTKYNTIFPSCCKTLGEGTYTNNQGNNVTGQSKKNDEVWQKKCCYEVSTTKSATNNDATNIGLSGDEEYKSLCCSGGVSNGAIKTDRSGGANDKRCCNFSLSPVSPQTVTSNASSFCCGIRASNDTNYGQSWTSTGVMDAYRTACCARTDGKGYCNCIGLYNDSTVGASATTLLTYFTNNSLTDVCCSNLIERTGTQIVRNQEKWQDTCCNAMKAFNVAGGTGTYQNNELWKNSCCDFPTDYANNTTYRGACCSGDGTRKSPNPDGSALISNKADPMFCCDPVVTDYVNQSPNTECCKYFKNKDSQYFKDNEGHRMSNEYKLACCRQSTGEINSATDYCPGNRTCQFRWQGGRSVNKPANWEHYNLDYCCGDLAYQRVDINNSNSEHWANTDFWLDNCCTYTVSNLPTMGSEIGDTHTLLMFYGDPSKTSLQEKKPLERFRAHCCKNQSSDHELISNHHNTALELGCCDPMLNSANPNPTKGCCTHFKDHTYIRLTFQGVKDNLISEDWHDYDNNPLSDAYQQACCTDHNVCPDLEPNPDPKTCYILYNSGRYDLALPKCCKILAEAQPYTDNQGNTVNPTSKKGDAVWQKTCCSQSSVVGHPDATESQIGITNDEYKQLCCAVAGGSNGNVKKEDSNTNTVNDARCCNFAFSPASPQSLDSNASSFCCAEYKDTQGSGWKINDVITSGGANADPYRLQCCTNWSKSGSTYLTGNIKKYCTCNQIYSNVYTDSKPYSSLTSLYAIKIDNVEIGKTCCKQLNNKKAEEKWRYACCRFAKGDTNILNDANFSQNCCLNPDTSNQGTPADGQIINPLDSTEANKYDGRCCNYSGHASNLTTNASAYCCGLKSTSATWALCDKTPTQNGTQAYDEWLYRKQCIDNGHSARTCDDIFDRTTPTTSSIPLECCKCEVEDGARGKTTAKWKTACCSKTEARSNPYESIGITKVDFKDVCCKDNSNNAISYLYGTTTNDSRCCSGAAINGTTAYNAQNTGGYNDYCCANVAVGDANTKNCCKSEGVMFGKNAAGQDRNSEACCTYTAENPTEYCCSQKAVAEGWAHDYGTFNPYRTACCNLNRNYCSCRNLYDKDMLADSASECCKVLANLKVEDTINNVSYNYTYKTQTKWKNVCCLDSIAKTQGSSLEGAIGITPSDFRRYCCARGESNTRNNSFLYNSLVNDGRCCWNANDSTNFDSQDVGGYNDFCCANVDPADADNKQCCKTDNNGNQIEGVMYGYDTQNGGSKKSPKCCTYNPNNAITEYCCQQKALADNWQDSDLAPANASTNNAWKFREKCMDLVPSLRTCQYKYNKLSLTDSYDANFTTACCKKLASTYKNEEKWKRQCCDASTAVKLSAAAEYIGLGNTNEFKSICCRSAGSGTIYSTHNSSFGDGTSHDGRCCSNADSDTVQLHWNVGGGNASCCLGFNGSNSPNAQGKDVKQAGCCISGQEGKMYSSGASGSADHAGCCTYNPNNTVTEFCCQQKASADNWQVTDMAPSDASTNNAWKFREKCMELGVGVTCQYKYQNLNADDSNYTDDRDFWNKGCCPALKEVTVSGSTKYKQTDKWKKVCCGGDMGFTAGATSNSVFSSVSEYTQTCCHDGQYSYVIGDSTWFDARCCSNAILTGSNKTTGGEHDIGAGNAGCCLSFSSTHTINGQGKNVSEAGCCSGEGTMYDGATDTKQNAGCCTYPATGATEFCCEQLTDADTNTFRNLKHCCESEGNSVGGHKDFRCCTYSGSNGKYKDSNGNSISDEVSSKSCCSVTNVLNNPSILEAYQNSCCNVVQSVGGVSHDVGHIRNSEFWFYKEDTGSWGLTYNFGSSGFDDLGVDNIGINGCCTWRKNHNIFDHESDKFTDTDPAHYDVCCYVWGNSTKLSNGEYFPGRDVDTFNSHCCHKDSSLSSCCTYIHNYYNTEARKNEDKDGNGQKDFEEVFHYGSPCCYQPDMLDKPECQTPCQRFYMGRADHGLSEYAQNQCCLTEAPIVTIEDADHNVISNVWNAIKNLFGYDETVTAENVVQLSKKRWSDKCCLRQDRSSSGVTSDDFVINKDSAVPFTLGEGEVGAAMCCDYRYDAGSKIYSYTWKHQTQSPTSCASGGEPNICGTYRDISKGWYCGEDSPCNNGTDAKCCAINWSSLPSEIKANCCDSKWYKNTYKLTVNNVNCSIVSVTAVRKKIQCSASLNAIGTPPSNVLPKAKLTFTGYAVTRETGGELGDLHDIVTLGSCTTNVIPLGGTGSCESETFTNLPNVESRYFRVSKVSDDTSAQLDSCIISAPKFDFGEAVTYCTTGDIQYAAPDGDTSGTETNICSKSDGVNYDLANYANFLLLNGASTMKTICAFCGHCDAKPENEQAECCSDKWSTLSDTDKTWCCNNPFKMTTSGGGSNSQNAYIEPNALEFDDYYGKAGFGVRITGGVPNSHVSLDINMEGNLSGSYENHEGSLQPGGTWPRSNFSASCSKSFSGTVTLDSNGNYTSPTNYCEYEPWYSQNNVIVNSHSETYTKYNVTVGSNTTNCLSQMNYGSGGHLTQKCSITINTGTTPTTTSGLCKYETIEEGGVETCDTETYTETCDFAYSCVLNGSTLHIPYASVMGSASGTSNSFNYCSQFNNLMDLNIVYYGDRSGRLTQNYYEQAMSTPLSYALSNYGNKDYLYSIKFGKMYNSLGGYITYDSNACTTDASNDVYCCKYPDPISNKFSISVSNATRNVNCTTSSKSIKARYTDSNYKPEYKSICEWCNYKPACTPKDAVTKNYYCYFYMRASNIGREAWGTNITITGTGTSYWGETTTSVIESAKVCAPRTDGGLECKSISNIVPGASYVLCVRNSSGASAGCTANELKSNGGDCDKCVEFDLDVNEYVHPTNLAVIRNAKVKCMDGDFIVHTYNNVSQAGYNIDGSILSTPYIQIMDHKTVTVTPAVTCP